MWINLISIQSAVKHLHYTLMYCKPLSLSVQPFIVLALKVVCADVAISSHNIITQMIVLLVCQHENLQEHDILT